MTRGSESRFELAAVAIIAVANLTLPRLSRRAFVPAALASAASVTWLARRAGASWSGLGMDGSAMQAGVGWGMAAGIPAALGVALAAKVPAVRRILADDQALRADPAGLRYHALVRIPFGTALPEEAMFRSALPAILARTHTRRAAIAISSGLFGVWHIVSTARQLRSHPERERIGTSRGRRGVAIAASVVATALAGLGLAALRERSGSFVAPTLAHTAVNTAGLIAGARIVRAERGAGRRG